MPERLHLCMVSDDFLPAATGVGVHLGLVAPELVRRGHRVSVLTTRRPGQAPLEDVDGIAVHRMPTVKLFDFYQAMPSTAALRRLLAAIAPDLVHHHYASLMMRRVAAAATSLGVPQVSTFHFGPEILTQPWPMRPLRGWVGREMVRVNNQCAAVVSPSANLVPELVAMGIQVPVRHISNPVAFSGDATVAAAPRPAGFVILYAGRLGPEKNLPYLLRAFQHLLRTHVEAVLWIAGRGPEEAGLRSLCASLGLMDRVRFLGFLDHATLATYYAACDVFVLPSLREVQPMVAIEAMRFGKPVILTSAIAAARELVAVGENGFIVNPASSADLCQCLVRLADDRAMCAEMGRISRSRASAYLPEVTVHALETLYHDVLGRQPA